jgi:hypothetical protein
MWYLCSLSLSPSVTGKLARSHKVDLYLPILLHKTCVKKSQTEVLGDMKVTKFDGFSGQSCQKAWTAEG